MRFNMNEFLKILEPLATPPVFRFAVILLVTDTFFGILRAIKEKRFNSCVGIDGAIRKAGMLVSLVLFFCMDLVLRINLIGFVPEQIRTASGLEKAGIMEFFALIYCMYEIVSVLKNMALAGLPVKKIWVKLKEWLRQNTGEISELPDEEETNDSK